MMKSFSTFVVVGVLCFFASTGNAIGQSLSGTPIGQQEQKDHTHAKPQITNGNHYSDTVKVVEHHEHIEDYDKFIKEQSDPNSHHHAATSATLTSATKPIKETIKETVTAKTSPVSATKPTTDPKNVVLDPLQISTAKSLQNNIETENSADMTAFNERRREKEAMKLDSLRHADALAKY